MLYEGVRALPYKDVKYTVIYTLLLVDRKKNEYSMMERSPMLADVENVTVM